MVRVVKIHTATSSTNVPQTRRMVSGLSAVSGVSPGGAKVAKT